MNPSAYASGPTAHHSSEFGYGRLAQLFSIRPEVALFRKFSQLNMMNLLRLQAELHDLEEELKDVRKDDRESDDPIRQHYGVSFRTMRINAEKGDSIQSEMLENIGKKLDEYNKALQNIAFLHQSVEPSDDSVKFLSIWLERDGMGERFLKQAGNEAFVWAKENRADLLTAGMVGAPDRFTRLINGKILDLYHFLIGRFSKSEKKVWDGKLRDYDESKIHLFSGIVIATLSAALPTAAILALYFIKNMLYRIAFVIVFTTFFAVIFAWFTGAKKAEIFAAASAFAAVEVVYIGSVASSDPTCVCSVTSI